MTQDMVKKTMARTKFSCGPKMPLLYSRCTSGAHNERQGSIGMGPMPCLPRETSLTPRSRSSPRHALALTGFFVGSRWLVRRRLAPRKRSNQSPSNLPPLRGARCPATKFPERNPQRYGDADPGEGLWISLSDGFRGSTIERDPPTPETEARNPRSPPEGRSSRSWSPVPAR